MRHVSQIEATACGSGIRDTAVAFLVDLEAVLVRSEPVDIRNDVEPISHLLAEYYQIGFRVVTEISVVEDYQDGLDLHFRASRIPTDKSFIGRIEKLENI
jgi:hypothetical protein